MHDNTFKKHLAIQPVDNKHPNKLLDHATLVRAKPFMRSKSMKVLEMEVRKAIHSKEHFFGNLLKNYGVEWSTSDIQLMIQVSLIGQKILGT